MVDLDTFKDVNDTLGHDVGDALLVAVAGRLSGAIRAGDLLVRLGGDEFAVLWERNGTELATLGDGVVSAFGDPVSFDSRSLRVRASVGIASSATGGDPLREADVAMYEAKRNGGNQYTVFDDRMRRDLAERTELQADMRRALVREELLLHYQPVVALATGEVVAVEALVRWQHPGRGLLPPPDFIPLIEQSDLIDGLGAWVVETACAQIAAWDRVWPDAPPIGIAINISARQLDDGDLPATIAGALSRRGIEPARLWVEVTETAVMRNRERAKVTVRALADSGVSIAIDDFGTGYASLTYLRELPIGAVKIDRSFIDGLGTEAEDTTIVAAVIGLAAQLGIDVVAEGVETEAQYSLLAEMGCRRAQGWFMSRAVPGGEIPEIALRQWAERRPADGPVSAGRTPAERGTPERTYRVVIADDDADDRALIRRCLAGDAAFSIVGEAADGQAAIDLVATRQPHFVLLDLKMPVLGGLDALPRILLAAPATKVVILSSYGSPGTADRALAPGAVAFLRKGGDRFAVELRQALDAAP